MTFEFTHGSTHTMMDLPTLIIHVLFAGFFVWLIFWSLRRGILSLMGKPLNARPCPLFWEEVEAKVLTTEEDEVWQQFHRADLSAKTGIPNRPSGQMRKITNCKVEYSYQGKVYQKTVYNAMAEDDTVHLYCCKGNPEQTKAYVPENNWSKGAGISYLMIGGFLLLIGIVIISVMFF